ncbi:MAG: OmpH family outer membrane protein [Leeuwenhoekiella sp.]
MRASVLFFILSILSFGVNAQRSIRVGYIDMEYILANVPEYQEAQTQLDNRVNKWKNEIDKEMLEIEQMKKTLDNERVLLTPELIEERDEEIAFRESEILDMQQQRFGTNGAMMQQRRNLVEPVQDQVFNAVQEIAAARKYDFIFDKSADLIMLYANERHDISDLVLRSITRAGKREQVNNRQDLKELEEDEARTVEQDKEISDRELQAEAKKEERERLIAERKADRDSIMAAKRKEYEENRAQILAERQRKRDSVQAVREGREVRKDTINNR